MPAVEQVITGEAAATTTVTVVVSAWTVQPQPGDILVALIQPRHTNRLVSGVVGHGLTWTAQAAANPGIWHTVAMWTAVVPPGGVTAADIVATFNGSANHSTAQVLRVSGGGTVETAAGVFANPATAAVSVALTGVTAGSLVVGGAAHVARTFTPGASWAGFLLNFPHSTANANTSTWGGISAAGGAVSVDGTLNISIEWAACAVSITPAGGAGPVELSGTSTTLTSGSGELGVNPDVPTGLAGDTAPAVALSWDAVAGADTYDVERDTVVIATGLTAPGHVDTDVAFDVEYTYRVRSVTATVPSDWSDPLNVTPTAGTGGVVGEFVWRDGAWT